MKIQSFAQPTTTQVMINMAERQKSEIVCLYYSHRCSFVYSYPFYSLPQLARDGSNE